MKKLTIAFLLISSTAFAQAPATTPTDMVPFTKQEQGVMMQMCEAAMWANRIQFGNVCEALARKFNEAAKPPPAGAKK